MSLFSMGPAPTTPQKNGLFGGGSNSLFGNNNQGGLFGNLQNTGTFGSNSNNLFGNNSNSNNGSLFNTTVSSNANNFSFGMNNSNTLFSNSNNNNNNNTFGNSIYNQQQIECSIGFPFKGKEIPEKNTNKSIFMSLVVLQDFEFASFEELRLADYESQKREI